MKEKMTLVKRLYAGFFQGVGWAFGVTFGFTLISAIIVLFLNRAGGIPVVGGFLARVVDATVAQLQVRTPDIYR